MALDPIESILSGYESRLAKTLAQLPSGVREVVDGIENAEGRELILERLESLQLEQDRSLQHGNVMTFLGLLAYALRVKHLNDAGYDVLSDYVRDI